MSNFVVETARLGLREMSLPDLDFMATLLGDPEVTRFYPKAYSRDEAAEWIERQLVRYDRDGHGFWLAIERDSGEPVGQVGLLMQELDGAIESEIGYMLHHRFWRRGFASEAARGIRDHAFATLGYERVISLIRPENIPSQRTALKVGMKPERLTTFHGLPHLVFSTTPDKSRLVEG